jgi:hypothetical protein
MQAYIPSMSDPAVKAKTGRDWSDWFGLLDAAGAAQLEHRAIARWLAKEHGVGSWWCQMVTVEYERARGLRARHETATGFSVAVSKTVEATLSDLYQAAASAARRKRWFPRGTFVATSQTEDKYLRGSWNGTARLELGFYAKGANKAQIAVQIGKLDKRARVEPERAAWKAALEKLAQRLAKPSAEKSGARRRR